MHRYLLIASLFAALVIFGACGGDDAEDQPSDGTPDAAKTVGGNGEDTPEASGTADDGGGDDAAGSGEPWTQEQAQALLNTLLIAPDDVPSVWTVMVDTTSDNAAAAATDPDGGASFERCGRLLGRVLVLQPEDVVTRYIGGETVSFFSQGTVYATTEGATDCAAEAAERLSNCPELAKAFGSVFIDPAAVSCVPFEYEQVGDGSIGIGLAGKISAAGTIVDLTIKVVAWRQGNVSAVAGMAAAFDPIVEELRPNVDLMVERITAAQ
jgi:hypothetical protein